MIGVYDDAGNVIETHERKGDFKAPIATSVPGNQECDNCQFFLQFSAIPYDFS
jgi:hypothetical protein